MAHPSLRRTATCACLFALAACDNVGRAFDRGGGGGGGGGNDNATTIAAASVGGTFFDGRPKVRAAFPTGSGWASTAPVVVVFNESLNEALAVPAQGEPLVFCRAKGTTQRVPSAFNFLQGGSVLMIRPLPEWPRVQEQAAEIEIVVDPEVRDTDGIRLGSGGDPIVVGSFLPDGDVQASPDGRIVATIPEDSGRDQPREVPLYLIFDRPAGIGTVTANNFRVSDGNGTSITGSVTTPIADAGVTDTRITRFDPSQRLPGDSEVRITVDDTITFANNGKLDFLGRSPFAQFRTLAFAAADVVAIAGTQPGFANKINRTNLQTAQFEITLPNDSRAGDEVVVRVYGLEKRTTPPNDVAFIEARAAVPADGTTLLTVPLGDALGTVDDPRFGDGPATFAARVRRSARTTGWMVAAAASDPVIDTGLPVVVNVGPPSLAGSSLDLLVDQEFVAFYGIANERVVGATVAMAGQTKSNFGSAGGGRFMLQPIPLTRSVAPVAYTLTLTDAAGNESQPIAGTVAQRGMITGTLAGTLTVEAFDEATLQPIPGAQVVIEPGLPRKPAVGQMATVTGADGRATFSGLPDPDYSISVVVPGYHLKSLLTTAASFVSLGLRPLTKATATLQGAVVFTAGAGVTARVGCNAFDDPLLESVAPAAGFVLPAIAIRPNRLLVFSGYAGAFDSAGNGTFNSSGFPMCGTNGVTATPAAPAVAPDTSATQSFAIQIPAQASTVTTARYNRDFAASTGLGAIQGGPTVRMAMSMLGLSGTTLFGIGTPRQAGSVTSFDVTATYSLVNALTLAPMSPVLWVSLEARDAQGNLARHRALVTDVSFGTTLGTWPTPGIPTITTPGGASSGAPSVTYEDRLAAATVPAGIAMTEILAADPAGRTWSILREDRTGAVGATTWQLPDLSGTPAVGLASGTWKVRVQEHLAFSVTAVPGDFMLEELRRAQVTFARTGDIDFVVN